jgi:hypothetical protein
MNFWYKVDKNVIDFRSQFCVKMKPIEAAKLTVQSIIDNYPSPYHLMISGGADSQAMLHSWVKFGSDFIPTSVIYNDFNFHDIDNIKLFYKNYVQYINFDLLSFLKLEYDSYSAKYRCSSPCISAYIKMIENLKGTIIFSGDPLIKKKPRLTNAILGLYRASLEKKTLIPYFFLQTPELTYSFSNLDFFNKKEYTQLNDYEKKIYNYEINGFPIIPQQTKYSGFEKVKDFYDSNYRDLVTSKDRLKYANKPSSRTFDLLYRYPYEEKCGDMDLEFILNDI